ncbi:hypothetical protein JMN32_15180 [Fulvivirga sp. 29W222]|uniref:Uncharacterized protein n=1 Tax=Fulvivirga marina TaxID=2494733 RepID=A0A937FX42_9BACT|nr:DUF6445 family protein [Fulvivirga marina]MBL6447659.1 hypothetical protein [Fulvivirga marina]
MEKNDIRIVDNFFADPLWIRENVLHSKFSPNTNSEFSSKKLGLSIAFKNQFRRQVSTYIDNVQSYNFIDSEFCYYTLEDEHINKKNGHWIHSDRCRHIGIVFLTPNIDSSLGGLSFYQHIASGATSWYDVENDPANQNLIYSDSVDLTKWHEYFYVEWKFNRLVIFNSYYFHQARAYFGNNIFNSRITLNIFFN